MSEPALLRVNNLTVAYETRTGRLKALDDVSFDVLSGQALALVGEPGSGKSTIALAVMGLLGAEAGMSGSIALQGQDLGALAARPPRPTRRRGIPVVCPHP